MVWAILFFLSVLVNVGLGFALARVSKRLLQFDELFSLFTHDIETNVKYLAKTLAKPLFTNTPEVVELNRNMSIIAKRLNEYANRFAEATGTERVLDLEEGQEQ